MLEFLNTASGWYLLASALAVGVCLTMNIESRASWVGVMIITAVFAAIAIAHASIAAGAVPVYAVVLALGSVAVTAHRYRESSPLMGEPYWRRFLLTLVHARQIRETAEREEE